MKIKDQLWFKNSDDIAREQMRLLRCHLNYCQRYSPFYRELLRDIDIKQVKLDELPTTNKQIFAENQEDFIVKATAGGTDICFTSGTTGIPCRMFYSQSDLKRLAYNDAVGFMAAGVTVKDRVLLTCTLDRCFIAGVAYYSGVQLLGASTIRNGLSTLESHVEMIKLLNPTVIVGVPSFLRRLGRLCREESISLNGINRIICIGEPLRNKDFIYTMLGEELLDLFQCSIHSTYASSEIATSFTECTQCAGGHLVPELAMIEILDPDGRVLPAGEIGEVTVTPLGVKKMPLVRFRTGDIAFLIDSPCKCGRATVRLGPILGRLAEMMKIRGTTLFPNSFFSVLHELPWIDEYYLERSICDDDSEHVEIFVASNEYIDIDKIVGQIYARTRIKVPVRVVSLESARSKIYAGRKPVRFFTSRIKHEV